VESKEAAMLLWVVRDTVYQANINEYVWRHYTLPTPTAGEALAAMRTYAQGKVSLVGYIRDGHDHYFPAQG
jgi:hypothetical protein